MIEDWIERSLHALKPAAKILEIGSAYGRDARIIEEKGFYVENTDATAGFVEILQKEDPDARILNVINDEIDGKYDLIIANAVFLHLNNSETRLTTKKVYDALKPHGTFSLTLKQGVGERWQKNKGMSLRYFNFWSKEAFVKLLAHTGFTDIDAWIDSSDGTSTPWIMIIAKK